MERRAVEFKELRVLRGTDAEQNSAPVIEGHAAVFNSFSEEMGGLFPFRERVMPGAFEKSLGQDDIRALWNHNPDYVLGRNKAGTLELKETPQGLKVRIFPPDTQFARDLMTSMERGDVTQMSFGFIVDEEGWTSEEGRDVRELRKVRLFDVSPVTFPAYTQTDVGVREAAERYEQRKAELESQSAQDKAAAAAKRQLLMDKFNNI